MLYCVYYVRLYYFYHFYGGEAEGDRSKGCQGPRYHTILLIFCAISVEVLRGIAEICADNKSAQKLRGQILKSRLAKFPCSRDRRMALNRAAHRARCYSWLKLMLGILRVYPETQIRSLIFWAIFRVSHLSNATCLTHAFFKSGESCEQTTATLGTTTKHTKQARPH